MTLVHKNDHSFLDVVAGIGLFTNTVIAFAAVAGFFIRFLGWDSSFGLCAAVIITLAPTYALVVRAGGGIH